jgi:DNA modification methylase
VIIHGDCLDVMAGMDPESVDAIVTDPPYGLEFMGKEWDKLGAVTLTDPSVVGGFQDGNGGNPFSRSRVRYGTNAVSMQGWHQQWAEAAYRVAKPSAYLLAFGGTRTVHRMTVALEDAGWIIRDMLVWAYASGFPKSKASLKPAWEPIVMARKPGPLRMLAIDECRLPTSEIIPGFGPVNRGDSFAEWSVRGGGQKTHHQLGKRRPATEQHPAGRWPANVILTDPIFDGGVEGVVGGGVVDGQVGMTQTAGKMAGWQIQPGQRFDHGQKDSGTYSRFFLVPKSARSDREPVLGGLPLGQARTALEGGIHIQPGRTVPSGRPIARQNVHPTVKPTDLMRHLVRLVTPTGGTVLDPFLGSGTTGLAAEMEGFSWIGIEREAEYVAIAEARLNGTQRGLGLESA